MNLAAPQKTKQLVILSGKGGTGKTSLTAALAHLACQSQPHINALLVDADVDAANLQIIIPPSTSEKHAFQGGSIAQIDPQLCIGCSMCSKVCRFDAVHPSHENKDIFMVDPLACDGCAACVYACPQNAIQMNVQQEGEWFHSQTRYGDMFHAELFPGGENSGKLVTTIKQHARLYAEDHHISLMIIDGPPGIGCPVISASAGVGLGLIVTEPSAAGIHDLKRIYATLQHFKITTLLVINKSDIYPRGCREIEDFAHSQQIAIVGQLPYEPLTPKAMLQGQPITAAYPDASISKELQQIWERLVEQLVVQENGT
jgi:MinD superfamily P-loop ATPase